MVSVPRKLLSYAAAEKYATVLASYLKCCCEIVICGNAQETVCTSYSDAADCTPPACTHLVGRDPQLIALP